jgi:hypothetical protein
MPVLVNRWTRHLMPSAAFTSENGQVDGIGGRGDEVEVLVETLRLVILGMDRERAESGDIGALQLPQHRILQQVGSKFLVREPSASTSSATTYGSAPIKAVC